MRVKLCMDCCSVGLSQEINETYNETETVTWIQPERIVEGKRSAVSSYSLCYGCSMKDLITHCLLFAVNARSNTH